MGKKDPRVDEYIAEAGQFTPLLAHLRSLIHKACPDIEETIKWSAPFFLHKGIVCSFAAFKHHASFGFWRWRAVFKDEAARLASSEMAMGNYGRLTSMADLPSDKEVISRIKIAVGLNDDPSPPPRVPKRAPKPVIVPKALAAALKKVPKAKAAFEAFAPSHRREYADWIAEAKTDETRERRVATAIEQLSAGKSRHWKYQNS